jgi:dihydroflavonol-4-reductase
VVITNPASVWGPHDPHMGETASVARNILRGRMRLVMPGGLGIVDVRDLATAHARIFTTGRGPRRYLLAGEWITVAEVYRLLERIVGHRLPRVRIPAGVALAAGRVADVAQTPRHRPRLLVGRDMERRA